MNKSDDITNPFPKLYQYVFWLFRMSGIYAIPKYSTIFSKGGILMTIFLVSHLLVCLLHIFANKSMLSHNEGFRLAFGNIFMTIACGINRIGLFLYLPNFQNLAIKVNKLYEKVAGDDRNKKHAHWIFVWMTVSTFMYLPLTANSIWTIFTNGLFGKEPDSINIILTIAYAVSLTMFFFLPLNAFAIFYTVICLQLRSILLQFANKINLIHAPNYIRLQKNFVAVRTIVKKVDRELCFFYFVNVCYNAAMMYFAVTMFLQPQIHKDAIQKSTIYMVCVNGFSGFLIMTMLASYIHEIFLDIADKADVVVEVNWKMIASQLRFTISTGRETALTAWRVVEVKRSLIFVALGTLFTYCILLYNLEYS